MTPIKSALGKIAKTAFTLSASNNYQQVQKSTIATTTVGTSSIPSSSDVSHSLSEMCRLFNASPMDALYLSSHSGGERGVCSYRPVSKGDIILSIPLASCFRDDEAPQWFQGCPPEEKDENDEYDFTDYERYNPSAWASRLAASILDMQLVDPEESKEDNGDMSNDNESLKKGRKMWQSMLPDQNFLRESLPVHWSEELLSNAKCTALELAVDSAYFARASAVMELSEELREVITNDDDINDEIIQQKCHDALDIVQTRACRVERTCDDGVQWGPPLRILAPIFDFINHGSKRVVGKGGANAAFGIEDAKMSDLSNAKLVVRAARDILEGEEVRIDYGDSARPAWRCLTSYGFIPDYSSSLEPIGLDDEEQAENVAELWMNGLRFEVDSQSIPYELAEVAAAQTLLDGELDEEELNELSVSGLLSPAVAKTIAKRAADTAFHLLLEPEIGDSEEEWSSPDLVHAASLAASLRWSQHKVLLKFAENIRKFAASSPDIGQ